MKVYTLSCGTFNAIRSAYSTKELADSICTLKNDQRNKRYDRRYSTPGYYRVTVLTVDEKTKGL